MYKIHSTDPLWKQEYVFSVLKITKFFSNSEKSVKSI